MRYVIWEDERGYLHRSLLRDADPDEMAPRGIPADPPSVAEIDFEFFRRELNNALVREGFFTWQDVMRNQGKILRLLQSMLKKNVIPLFKQHSKNGNQEVSP